MQPQQASLIAGTKEARAQMAKRQSRTREARRRRQQQRRRNRRLYLLIAIVMVAVVGIAVVFVSNQPVDAHVPGELSARYQDIRRSFSPEGYPRLGVSDAPVTVAEYASFACPGCEAFHSASFDAVLERAREGQARFTYIPLNTGSVPNAEGASRAALCAGVQGMFWEMHDVLFDWQTRYGNTAFSQNRLLAGIEALELDGEAFTNCFNSAGISSTLDAAQREDVGTTPTIRVNGVTLDGGGAIPSTDAILEAIDDATPADWGMPVEAPEPEPAQEEAAAEVEPEPTVGEATAPPEAAPEESATEIAEDESAEPQPAAEPAPQDDETAADSSAGENGESSE